MPAKREVKTKKREVSPEEYRDFIKRIDLEDIFFAKASFKILVPEMLKIEEIGVDVKNRAELVVRYSSEKKITDDIFGLFKEVNLPVNTWPYFREYVHSCMGRLNLPPLVLPALKRP